MNVSSQPKEKTYSINIGHTYTSDGEVYVTAKLASHIVGIFKRGKKFADEGLLVKAVLEVGGNLAHSKAPDPAIPVTVTEAQLESLGFSPEDFE